MIKKIYCAGPTFSLKEREEMEDISSELAACGFIAISPLKECLEAAAVIDPKETFDLEVSKILECDGLVYNMNGRVPDEGSAVMAGIAWQAGKEIVLYKNDMRTLLLGVDNPLILGLGGFVTVWNISEIPTAFEKLFNPDDTAPHLPGF